MTTEYRAADFDGALVEFGVAVKLLPSGGTAFGVVDRASEDVLRGSSAHSVADRIAITYRSSALALAAGVQVLVDGADTYVVREVRRLEKDGAFSQALCMRTS